MTRHPRFVLDSLQDFASSQETACSSALEGIALHLPARLCSALLLLLESHDYARDLETNPWEFAVDVPTLKHCGLIKNDYRWLVGRGLVKFAMEVTLADESHRSFRRLTELRLARLTCFVLTESGIDFARKLKGSAGLSMRHFRQVSDESMSQSRLQLASPLLVLPEHPTWDRDRQELRVGKLVVKQFKVPAANQETILGVFEEEHWPSRIDDPLSPRPELHPKRRLHDTINSLNRNQKRGLVRFLGDGSGQGVRWEFAKNDTDEVI